MIRREDFSDVCPYHFGKNGEGFRHMAAFVFKVCKEFFDDCSKIVYFKLFTVTVELKISSPIALLLYALTYLTCVRYS